MKNKLFLLLMAFLLLPATNALADYALRLQMKDGTTQMFLIASKPNLTIADGVLSVKSTATEFSCELGQVDFYDFPSDIDPAGIESIKSDGGMTIDGGLIVFSGLKGNTEISVFTIDGKKATAVRADINGNATISLSQLPKGVCIVKAGTTSTKIINK